MADRLATGDPRRSPEERYGDHAGFANAVRQAAQDLVRERFPLQEDGDAFSSGVTSASRATPEGARVFAARMGGRTRSRMAQLTDKRKQSLYFPEDMLQEIQEEATRQDRSLSWIVQQAWRAARAQIAKMPGLEDLGPSTRA